MKLISELHEDVQYITEERDGRKNLYLEGTFLQGNVKNRNGRIYPMPVLEREVNRYSSDLIANNRAMGELGHPSTPGLNLDRVSHLVTECRRSGNDFVGRAKILDTPMGKIAESLIQAGARLGVSSRGMGSLKEDSKLGAMVVQNDFNLAVMIDIVADPSAPGAWVNGVMENIEWTQNAQGEWEQRALDEVRRTIHATPSSLLPERKLQVFESYVDAVMEATMVDTLAKHAGIERSDAASVVRRAKLKARLTGNHADSRFVWATAKGMLGEDNFVKDVRKTFMRKPVSGAKKHDPATKPSGE